MKILYKLSCTALAAAAISLPLGAYAQYVPPSAEQLEAIQERENIRARALLRCNTQRGIRCESDDVLYEWEAEERARARPATRPIPGASGRSDAPATARPAGNAAGASMRARN